MGGDRPRTELVIGGVRHAAPFAHLLRPLTAAERRDLRQSVEAHGVLAPVVVYDSPAHGPAVIDGVQRALAAAAVGRPVPVRPAAVADDAAALALCLSLNPRRRPPPDRRTHPAQPRPARPAPAAPDPDPPPPPADPAGLAAALVALAAGWPDAAYVVLAPPGSDPAFARYPLTVGRFRAALAGEPPP